MSAPVLACDLDGVVWRGDEPVPAAADGIAALRAAGWCVAFVSNNSNSPLGDVVAKLEHLGVPATPGDVVTSATAAAWLLAQSLDPGARVLACAGPGVREALAGHGLVAVDDGPAEAVVVGFHREFDYAALDRASAAVRAGARFVATNLDATYPMPGGLIPGAGALVAAVATAAGSAPEVAGKPEAPTVGLIRERFGTHGVVVGDRPSTDGALATNLGWPFALGAVGRHRGCRAPGRRGDPRSAAPVRGG